ncbi:MAG TPA: DUF2163 domain-containing protein [Fimbriimonadaceae bacterium]
MRTFPSGFFASQTRCFAVLISRTDGTKFGLTNHNAPFSFGGNTYQPVDGVDVPELNQKAGTSVDELEIKSILNDSLGRITRADLLAGRYDGADVWLYEVDYETPTDNMILGRFRPGLVKMGDSGYGLELRGIEFLLKNQIGRTIEYNCDAMKFGNIVCDPGQTLRAARTFDKTVCFVMPGSIFSFDVPVTTFSAYDAGTTYAKGDYVSYGATDSWGQSQIFISLAGGNVGNTPAVPSTHWQSVGYPNNPGYFSFGDGLWTGGANDGLGFDIGKQLLMSAAAYDSGATYSAGFYVTSGGTTYVSLVGGNSGHTPSSSPDYWAAVSGNPVTIQRIIVSPPGFFSVAVGDTCSICFGCDRTPVTCQSVVNPLNPSGTNFENYQGFPFLAVPDLVRQVGQSG